MASSRRQKQIADEVQRIISETLLYKIKDPNLDVRVSIVDVEMSGDLSIADVYYSVLGDEERREVVGKSLHKAASFFRKELGNELRIRKVPRINFIEDRSIAEGFYMDNLIDKVRAEDAKSSHGKE